MNSHSGVDVSCIELRRVFVGHGFDGSRHRFAGKERIHGGHDKDGEQRAQTQASGTAPSTMAPVVIKMGRKRWLEA